MGQNITATLDVTDDNPYIQDFFKGTGNTISGPAKKSCEEGINQNQKIRGVGPFCNTAQEEGEYDQALCVFDKTAQCIQEFSTASKDACDTHIRGFVSEHRGGVEVTDTPCPGEENQDDGPRETSSQTDKQTSQNGAAGSDASTPGGGDKTEDGGSQNNEPKPDPPTPGTIIREYREARCKSIKAIDDYKKCLERVKNECECTACVLTIPKRGEDESETDNPNDPTTDDVPTTPDDPDNPDPDTDPGIRRLSIRTNSNFGPIPLMYGRYVISGNLIWVGNKRTSTFSYTRTGNDGKTTNATDNLTTVDIVVGLAIGKVKQIMRAWVADALVLNNVVDENDSGQADLTGGNQGIVDLNLNLLAEGELATARIAFTRPTIELFQGGEQQHVLAEIAQAEGFGRVPAHRGLAYVVIKDVDIANFGGAFPDFRFDVQTDEGEIVVPKSELVIAHDHDVLDIDRRTNTLYTTLGDRIDLTNGTTFTSTYDSVVATTTSRHMLLRCGEVASVSTPNMLITDAYRDRTSNSTALGALGDASVSFSAFDAVSRVPFEMIIATQADTDFELFRYDYNTRLLEKTREIVGEPNLVSKAGLIVGLAGRLFFFNLCLDSGTQNNLTLLRYRMRDSDGSLASVVGLTPYTIPGTSLWGTATSGVTIKHVVHSVIDNSALVFFDVAGAQTIAKISFDTDDLIPVVVWKKSVLTAYPTMFSKGAKRVAVGSYYNYIGAGGVIARVNLATGEMSEPFTLTDYTLPALDGAQLYEDSMNAITYLASDRIVRIFLDRLGPTKVSLKTIFDDLLTRSRLPSTKWNTDALADIEIDGFLINAPTSVRSVMEQIGELYQIAIYDDGEVLTFVKESTIIGTPVVLDSNSIVFDTVDAKRVIVDEQTERLSLEFSNINNKGLVRVLQTVALDFERGERDEANSPSIALSVNINDSATNMRLRAEQVLRTRRSDKDSLGAVLFPKHLGLTARDRVSYNGTVYAMREIEVDTSLGSRVSGVFVDTTAYQTDVDLQAVAASQPTALVSTIGHPPYRPVALFLPMISNVQASVALDNQIIYVGIDTPTRTNISPAKFSVRMVEGPDFGTNIQDDAYPYIPTPTSPLYNTPTFTEGVHVGQLVTAPLDSVSIYGTDTDSAMTIAFDHADTLTLLQTFAGRDVLEQVGVNLLVVGNEYIQFADYTVNLDQSVTFHNLFRGRHGTGSYTGEHPVGQECFLYTPASFRPMIVNPIYTRNQQTARMFFRTPLTAGTPTLEYGKRSDAGSYRPPPVTDISRFSFGGNPYATYLEWKRVRPFTFDFMESGGTQPYDYDGGYIVFSFTRKPTMEEFDKAYVRAFDDGIALDEGYGNSTRVIDNNRTEAVNLGGVGLDPFVDTFYFAVAEVRLDANQNAIVGYPTFAQFAPGAYPTI